VPSFLFIELGEVREYTPRGARVAGLPSTSSSGWAGLAAGLQALGGSVPAAVLHPKLLQRSALLVLVCIGGMVLTQLMLNTHKVLKRRVGCPTGPLLQGPANELEAGESGDGEPWPDAATSKTRSAVLHWLAASAQRNCVPQTLFRPVARLLPCWMLEAEARFMQLAMALGLANAIVPLICLPVVAYTFFT
jgi:hypothetical protein